MIVHLRSIMAEVCESEIREAMQKERPGYLVNVNASQYHLAPNPDSYERKWPPLQTNSYLTIPSLVESAYSSQLPTVITFISTLSSRR